jgi:hypothetical protein
MSSRERSQDQANIVQNLHFSRPGVCGPSHAPEPAPITGHLNKPKAAQGLVDVHHGDGGLLRSVQCALVSEVAESARLECEQPDAQGTLGRVGV